MITDNQNRKISSWDDIVGGIGLSIDPKVSFLSTIASESIFNLTQKTSIVGVKSLMELDFWFEAGYSIKADYLVSAFSEATAHSNIAATMHDLISMIENAELEIDIVMNEGYDLPFNNWTATARSHKVLEELLRLSEDYRHMDFDIADHDLGETIVYTGEDECKSVAYGLRYAVAGSKTKYPETGFTGTVVLKLHSEIKTKMIEALRIQYAV